MASTIQKADLAELIQRARTGSGREREDAVEELTAYARRVSFAYVLLRFAMRDRERANDIAQDVAVQFYLHLGDIDPTRPDAWIIKCAKSRAIDQLRRDQRLRELQTELMKHSDGIGRHSAFEDIDERESTRRMEAMLERLPGRERIIIRLNVLEGLKPADIAVRLQITPKSASRLLNIAKERLRQLYERSK